VDAVELEQPTEVRADFLLDVSVPPIGGEFERSAFGAIGGDVIGAFELNDVVALPGLAGEAPSFGVLKKFHAEFGAGISQSIDVADFSLDCREVTHVFSFGGLWVEFVLMSGRELQPAPAHLAEAFDQLLRVLCREGLGMIAKLRQALLEAASRGRVVAILLSGHPQQLLAGAGEHRGHFVVVGEVQRLKPIDEITQPIERLLMDAAGFAATHAREHVVAQLRGFLTESRNAFGDEALDTLTDVRGRGSGRFTPRTKHFSLIGEAHNLYGHVLGNGDLEEPDLKGKLLPQDLTRRKGFRDLSDEPFPFVDAKTELTGKLSPLFQSIRPVTSILVEEPFTCFVELLFLNIETRADFIQFGVGQEMADTTKERKRALIDRRMSSRFAQCEGRERLFGKQPFVAETHEPIAHLFGIEAEVGRIEFLVKARVAHADVDKHALAGEHVENAGIAGIGLVHVVGVVVILICCFGGG
jgi:hypothetical protein